MSLQLTLARAEMRAAEESWRDHRLHCPLCDAAVRERKLERLCGAGGLARERYAEARHAVERERTADLAPPSGADPLW